MTFNREDEHGIRFNIPAADLPQFDTLNELLSRFDDGSDDWWEISDEIMQQFRSYIVVDKDVT